MNKNIRLLQEVGQSIWYDNLSKDILVDGTLSKLINEGITGLTSNPAIFEQAIAKTATYHENIKLLKSKNYKVSDICDRLMLDDVANAADLLRPTYQNSGYQDGYASLQVSPLIANDTLETIQAAKAFWKELARPNIMIKIPATPAGIFAIEDLISFGININVTLIFSPTVYQEVITAYLAGLRKRLNNQQDISRVHSVASFFISRADSWFENQLPKHPDLQDLVGKVGVANGLKAYQVFEDNFNSLKFQELEANGANIQRILWASTGVKNKNLDPLLYVRELPFRNSVATHPPALIEAILNSTNLQISNPSIDFEDTLLQLKSAKIDIEKMYQDLLSEGVDKFAVAYQQLLKAIEDLLV